MAKNVQFPRITSLTVSKYIAILM